VFPSCMYCIHEGDSNECQNEPPNIHLGTWPRTMPHEPDRGCGRFEPMADSKRCECCRFAYTDEDERWYCQRDYPESIHSIDKGRTCRFWEMDWA
jgi:hypothetical protein